MPEKVTLKIPRPLYIRLQGMIKDSDFSSVTEYVTFILRLVLSEKKQGPAELSVDELEQLKDRLQNLGTF